MKTTILLFHPDYAKSKANCVLVDAVRPLDGVEVVDMTATCPDGKIDLDQEVARLFQAERLVLQFPIQWYSTPSLLKSWQDQLLTRMYYINAKTEGERLRDLPVMVAATAGNDPSAYTPEGINLFPLEELLKPLHATAHRCFWRWTDPFLIYRSNKSSPEELAAAGRRYAARLTGWAEAAPAR